MRTPQRLRHANIIQRLLDQPYRYELVQALRMVELWLARNGITGERGVPCMVRFQNSLSMTFPPSQIEALTATAAGQIGNAQALQSALARGQVPRWHLTSAQMGYFGVHGMLPYHYTDSIANQVANEKFEGGRAFFDVFTNRLMHLQYQAWSKYRIHYRQDEHGRDMLLHMQLALAGTHAAHPPSNADDVADDSGWNEVAAYYGAVLRHHPTSACTIAAVLSEFFGVRVQVEQFIGCWDVLADADQWKLGTQRSTLGEAGVMLGDSCWDRKSTARLRVGPLTRAQFDHFLPDAEGSLALRKMLSLFALPPVAFDLRLVLRAADVSSAVLSAPGNEGGQLGLSTFLDAEPATADRDDVMFRLL